MKGPTPSKRVLHEIFLASGTSFRENSKSWIFACPRCGKQDKLYMLKETGRFVCWVCKEVEGYQGSPEYVLADLTGQSVTSLKQQLYGDASVGATLYLNAQIRDFWSEDEVPDEDADELVPQVWPLDYYPIDHKHSQRGRDYLAGRGIDVPFALKYGLRYCPPQRRVFFPIASQGVLYGWQGRTIGDTVYEDKATGELKEIPKVVTLKGVKKELTLMFLDRLNGSTHAVVTEGPVDGMKADLCGGNVVTMGKAVSRSQIGIIRNSGVRDVYLALDPDAAAEVLRLTREFSDLNVFSLRAPEPWHDLGEMTTEAVHQTWQTAPAIHNGLIFGYVEGDFDKLQRRRFNLTRRPALPARRFSRR